MAIQQKVSHAAVHPAKHFVSGLSYAPLHLHRIQRFSASVPDGLTPPMIGD
jgi:hypothetical protein